MSGVRNLAAGLASLARVNQAIRGVGSLEAATEAATEVAKVIDGRVRAEFAAGQTVYDTARPLGVDGNKLSLFGRTYIKYASQNGSHKSRGINKPRQSPGSGKKKSLNHVATLLGFKAVGTIVRANFPTAYTKYLVGKYRILPMKIPPTWRPPIREAINKVLAARMAAAGARVAA